MLGRPDLPQVVATAAPGTAVFACGPPAMLADVEAAAAERDDITLHLERFGPVATMTGQHGPFLIETAVSGLTLEVGGGESMLSALEAAGIVPPSTCREGVFGSCEVAVLEGAINHLDTVLSPAERRSDRVMLACVSRARGDRRRLHLWGLRPADVRCGPAGTKTVPVNLNRTTTARFLPGL